MAMDQSSQVLPCLPRFAQPTHPVEKDWNLFRRLITQLYVYEGKPLKDVQSHLLDKYNFRATPRMFNARFLQWGVSKSVKKDDVDRISNQIVQYRQQHGTDPVEVEINGKYVDIAKVQRSLRRHRLRRTRKSGNSSGSMPCAPSMSCSKSSMSAESNEVSLEEVDDTNSSHNPGQRSEAPVLSDTSNSGRQISHDTSFFSETLTAEELSTLHVVMLQTDFFVQDAMFQRPSSHPGPSRDGAMSGHQSPTLQSRSWRQSPELEDLQFMLWNTREHYGRLSRRRGSLTGFECRPQEKTTARDFYARYWLALTLLDHFNISIIRVDIAENLLKASLKQVRPAFVEGHPHLLPWLCFLICNEPRTGVRTLNLRNSGAKFAVKSLKNLFGWNSPVSLFKKGLLETSDFRRDICLCVLQEVISIFRSETQDAHLKEMQVLSRLFEHVAEDGNIDSEGVESVLEKWARTSKSIADVIANEREGAAAQNPTEGGKDPLFAGLFEKFSTGSTG